MSVRLSRHLPAVTARRLIVLALAAVVLWAGQAMLKTIDSAASSQFYTVSEVQANLERHPAAWVGRTAWVRGIVVPAGCGASDATPCHDKPVYLLDRSGAVLLPLTERRLNPLVVLLRRLPLVGRFVPGAPVVHWGTLATYRVQLVAAPATTCSAAPCYQALLDAIFSSR
jgi:hypothetical protein